MMLVEEVQVPTTALPENELKQQLRIGTGFAEDDLQTGIINSFLRAAMAAIEARTSKALITRGFVLTLTKWRDPVAFSMPIGPLQSITEVTLVDAYGFPTVVEPSTYRLEQDSHVPRLVATKGVLPVIPIGGSVELRFVAGFGANFADIPSDLGQAVLLLAAHYYEYRNETALSQGCMPFGVTSLVARYRPMRVGLST